MAVGTDADPNIFADARTDAKPYASSFEGASYDQHRLSPRRTKISERSVTGPVIKECLKELIFNGLRHVDNDHTSGRIWSLLASIRARCASTPVRSWKCARTCHLLSKTAG